MSDPTAKVSNHPVLLHKLTKLRSKHTSSKDFRQLMHELTFYLGYETTADLNARPIEFESPIATGNGAVVADRVCLVPILRAGLGMVDAMLEVVPYAKVHHIGMYREKNSLVPILYYNRLPAEVDSDIAIVLEPMIATAGTINACVTMLKQWGVKRIKVLSIIASKQGLSALHKAHPDVEVHVAAVDDALDEDSYIVPGLGDVGDRLWGTLKESAPAGDASTPSTGAGAGAGAGAAKGTKRARKD